jgi:hypothetical protein
MQDSDLVPELSSTQAKKDFDHERWYLFARRCQRNPFMREMIMKRDLVLPCGWCGQPIVKHQSWNIHHIDYAHECTYGITTIEKTVSIYNNPRNYRGPDCRSCFFMESEQFQSCFKRLRLVHRTCNQKIELARQSKRK